MGKILRQIRRRRRHALGRSRSREREDELAHHRIDQPRLRRAGQRLRLLDRVVNHLGRDSLGLRRALGFD